MNTRESKIAFQRLEQISASYLIYYSDTTVVLPNMCYLYSSMWSFVTRFDIAPPLNSCPSSTVSLDTIFVDNDMQIIKSWQITRDWVHEQCLTSLIYS